MITAAAVATESEKESQQRQSCQRALRERERGERLNRFKEKPKTRRRKNDHVVSEETHISTHEGRSKEPKE